MDRCKEWENGKKRSSQSDREVNRKKFKRGFKIVQEILWLWKGKGKTRQIGNIAGEADRKVEKV